MTAPQVSNRILQSLLRDLAERLGPRPVEEAWIEAGLPWSHLADGEGWVSLGFCERFEQELHRLLGRPEPPAYDDSFWQPWREHGRRALHERGPLAPIIQELGSPRLFYQVVPALLVQGTRLIRAEVVEQGAGTCTVRCRPVDPELPDRPSQCWHRRGLLEGGPTLWGLPPARVEHPICMHARQARAPHCQYVVRFPERAPWRWLDALVWPGLAGGLALGVAGVAGVGPLGVAWAGVTGGLLGAAVAEWRRSHHLQQLRQEEAAWLTEQITANDQRVQQLWEEQRALRLALLTNRKIAGYLSPEVVEEITSRPEREPVLGGVRTDAAVLFADLVGFTPRCEAAPPEQVVEELNIYFAHLDPAIARHGGVIDKRIGDGIMAVFASRSGRATQAELRRRAVACGLDLLAALTTCNARLAERGARPLQVRIGIAAGPLVQGTMGSEVKLEYTVIGDVVNLAARLEQLAPPGALLVEAVDPEALRELGRVSPPREVKVKGKERAVRVVEVRPD